MLLIVLSSLSASLLCVLAGYGGRGNYGYGYNDGYGYNNYHNYPVKRVLFTHPPYFPQVYPPYNPYYGHRPYYTRIIVTKPFIKVLPPIYKTIKYPVKVKQPVIINKVPVITKTTVTTVKKQPPIIKFGKPMIEQKDISNQVPINSVDEKMPDIVDDAKDVGVKDPMGTGVDGGVLEEAGGDKEVKKDEMVGVEGGEEGVKKEEGGEEEVKKEEGGEEEVKKEENVGGNDVGMENGEEKKKENGGDADFDDYTDQSRA